MEKMDGKIRRERIVEILQKESEPISGSALAKMMGVSRQVIVQDITLLRTVYPVVATAKGYLFYPTTERKHCRTFRVKHSLEDTRDELNRIVDLGGTVLDVIVEHDIYRELRGELMLSCRKDVEKFCDRLEKSRSGPLNIIGCGVHCHTIEAATEEILEEIEKSLHLYLI